MGPHFPIDFSTQVTDAKLKSLIKSSSFNECGVYVGNHGVVYDLFYAPVTNGESSNLETLAILHPFPSPERFDSYFDFEQAVSRSSHHLF